MLWNPKTLEKRQKDIEIQNQRNQRKICLNSKCWKTPKNTKTLNLDKSRENMPNF